MLAVKQETASMVTRDGIRLDADIYRPESEEKFPILLMRQPYGRKIASTVVYAHPIWYASQGYIVVIQDVRGRGTSQGKFNLFAHEIEDGFDTVNWVAQLPGSTGKVGMYGFSYQGMTQLYAAAAKPIALKTICPSMTAYDLYNDWAYENGAFCLQANLSWAIQLATETARLIGDEIAFQKLYVASRNLPLYDSIAANPNVLKEFAPDCFYHDWLSHPEPDSYWQKLSPKNLLQDADLPMLHIGGWFDLHLRGTLNLYHAMVSQSQYLQNLIIGPWAHLPWGRKVGTIDYGREAHSLIDYLQIEWFDFFLKDRSNKLLDKMSIQLFEMGSNQWRYVNEFPKYNQQAYYLTSYGLASINEDDGKLLNYRPAESLVSADVFVHDPWRPVPALGGHAAIPSGAFERSSLDCRSDILTYTSYCLDKDLQLVGEVFLELDCIADTPSFDLCAVLSEVYPDGRVYNFTQGYIRVDSSDLPIRIPLQPTCMRIAQGNSLRLTISAACFPAYPVNSGTKTLLSETRLIDAQVITLKVKCGGEYLSKVLLPIG